MKCKHQIPLVAFFSLVLLCLANIAQAAGLSTDDEAQLQRPHDRIFYLRHYPVELNIQEQVSRAYELVQSGEDYPMALAVLNQIIMTGKGNGEVYLLRGLVYTEIEQYAEAEKNYLEALRFEPDVGGRKKRVAPMGHWE
ncbi:MAG: tetratricopeptide repeat protein [Selenomonadaceae bacterium]|nr:tetratricopeptide repeat protein [Selenomonadaceae bacterium]